METKLATIARTSIALSIASAVLLGQQAIPNGRSFAVLASGFTQQLVGVTPAFLGGVAVLPNGDVISADCVATGTRLHRFSPSATFEKNGTVLASETVLPSVGGCGLVWHPDGTLYLNMDDGSQGIANVDPATGAALRTFGPRGNALGIAVDPLTHHLVYVGRDCRGDDRCRIFEADPVTAQVVEFADLRTGSSGPGGGDEQPDWKDVTYVGGLYFDPTGQFLFLSTRLAFNGLTILDRSGAIVQQVDMSSEPNGIGFSDGSPAFVVTSNTDGTITRFDFPGGDFTRPPTVTPFASAGFRGDLLTAGPDGCIYATQDGTRYDDVQETTENSIVRICGGFAPVPGYPTPAFSSLCGFVYSDANNDGVRNPVEPGIAGTTVTVTGTDDLRRAVSLTTTTAATGEYCFTNLRPGTYTIAESPVAGYLDGRETQGTPGTGTIGNDLISGIVLDAGVNGRDNNFAELVPSSLCGYVYLDGNNNGLKEAGESGIGGANVTVSGGDDIGGTLALPVTTGPDGAYCATNLRPGTYSITEVQPLGYLDGFDRQGTPGTGVIGEDAFTGIALNPGVDGRDNNFGERLAATGSISGYAYMDVNKNSIRDAGEPGVGGVLIRLGADLTAVTSANGSYSFTALEGNLSYAVTAPTSAAGLTRSTAGFITVNLASGESRPGVNFGYIDKIAPICSVYATAKPPYMTYQDTGSGIAKLEIIKNLYNNYKVSIAPAPSAFSPALTQPYPMRAGTIATFGVATKDVVKVTAVRMDTRVSAQLTVKAYDVFGNNVTCDPVETTVTKLRHERGIQTFTQIPYDEHIVTITNGTPGLRGLDVVVNGTVFRARKLDDGEIVVIDVRSAMYRRRDNTITLIPRGKKGESADVTIGPVE